MDGHPHGFIQGGGKAVPAGVIDSDIGALAAVFYPFRICKILIEIDSL